MARRKAAPAPGVRQELIDHLRAWLASMAERGFDLSPTHYGERLRALEAGEPVILADWETPIRERGAATYRLEADDELTPVRPIVFHGAHRVDGRWLTSRHHVAYEPIERGGARERIVGLDELGEYVDDLGDWRA